LKVLIGHFWIESGADQCVIKLQTTKCGRTLFVYNCKEIEADLSIYDPVGTSGNVNITLYADSALRPRTCAIDIRARFRGNVQNPTSNHSLLSHNFVWTGSGTTGTMRNVRIDIDVELLSGSNVRALAIHKYANSSGSSAADTTSGAWQLQNITWSGTISNLRRRRLWICSSATRWEPNSLPARALHNAACGTYGAHRRQARTLTGRQ